MTSASSGRGRVFFFLLLFPTHHPLRIPLLQAGTFPWARKRHSPELLCTSACVGNGSLRDIVHRIGGSARFPPSILQNPRFGAEQRHRLQPNEGRHWHTADGCLPAGFLLPANLRRRDATQFVLNQVEGKLGWSALHPLSPKTDTVSYRETYRGRGSCPLSPYSRVYWRARLHIPFRKAPTAKSLPILWLLRIV